MRLTACCDESARCQAASRLQSSSSSSSAEENKHELGVLVARQFNTQKPNAGCMPKQHTRSAQKHEASGQNAGGTMTSKAQLWQQLPSRHTRQQVLHAIAHPRTLQALSQSPSSHHWAMMCQHCRPPVPHFHQMTPSHCLRRWHCCSCCHRGLWGKVGLLPLLDHLLG
jgi:hypothetical protein